jgi:hypothetical protein
MWFNNYFQVKEPGIRQNDFGGTAGGPVRIPRFYNGKDKLFFFVSYEGLRLVAPQPAAVNFVPDLALRSSAPAVLAPVLQAYSVPNGLDSGGGIAEFTGSWSNPSAFDSTSVRVDYNLNSTTNVFFRFSDTGSDSATRPTATNGIPGSPNDPFKLNVGLHTYTFGATSALTSRVSNDLRVNYSSNDSHSGQSLDGVSVWLGRHDDSQHVKA